MALPLKICFLFNAQLHQVLHGMPTAVRLARKRGVEVDVVSPSRENIAVGRRIADEMGGAPIKFIHHRSEIAGAVGSLSRGSLGTKKLTLFALRELLATYDAIAVPERTSIALKRMGLAKPVFVQLDHGAGDGAFGYERRIREFDFVLVAGKKQRRRMLNAEIVRHGHLALVGYPKFEAADALRDKLWSPFKGDRPIVLYTPHYGAHGSWGKTGLSILEAFARQSEFYLIFAPHVRLFDDPAVRRLWGTQVAALANSEQIFVDLGSQRSVDMTYTELADIYLGDSSSQVYEFLRRPRPCVFLNLHGVDWRTDENYAHWNFGPVIDSAKGIVDVVRAAPDSHESYRAIQEAAFARTFDQRAQPPSERAAAAIAKYLRREVPARRVRYEHNFDRRKMLTQAAAALLLVSVGWGVRGKVEPSGLPRPTLAMEADQARDELSAIVPPAHAKPADYKRLARENGLPALTVPADWRVISSEMIRTDLGPVMQIYAITGDGVEVAIMGSKMAERSSGAPIISNGDDERIASWDEGEAAYAMAAQTTPKEMKLLVHELSGSGTTS
jgi:hypothetical protein